MHTLRRFALVALLLCGCYRTQYEPVTSSSGRVLSKTFVEGYWEYGLEVSADEDGASVTPTADWVPPKYLITFLCPAGQFEFDDEKLYEQYAEAQKVTVYHQTKHRIYKTKTNSCVVFVNVGRHIPEGTLE